ncbi:hypothetical protein SCLCIDRAFT_115979 [Scleroderma citrinum Foug A]|uniref:Uncharacterized protein n=1 Tax=Scleroderma citrinum Foug A TaxID=1036808 RepID=A0A0C3E6K2_9AGAM|nr:hypothetical protein SCLCIDRAFT_115979 [Scleroderma citrinum Foug A]
MPSCKAHPVPTFYDMPEPPQPLPTLSLQTEMCHQPKYPMAVSSKEEIAISYLLITAPTTSGVMVKMQCMTTPRTTNLRATTPRAASPITKPSGKSVAINEDGKERSNSPLPSESSLSSLGGDEESSRKIPEPISKVGRPGQGKFPMMEVRSRGLTIASLQWFVRKAVTKHLDQSKCHSLQDCNALEAINKMVSCDCNQYNCETHPQPLGHSCISRP